MGSTHEICGQSWLKIIGIPEGSWGGKVTSDVNCGFASWDSSRESWYTGPCGEMVGKLTNHTENVFGWVIGGEDAKTKCTHCSGDGRGNEAKEIITEYFDVCRVCGETREKVLLNGES